jgi:chemotaxis signal transduction protein
MPLSERKLVVLSREAHSLALCVDRASDPEEFDPQHVVVRDRLGGTEHGRLSEALRAIVKTPRGSLPVIEPFALFSRQLLLELSPLLHSMAGAEPPGG